MTAAAPRSWRFRPDLKATANGARITVLIPAMAIFPLLALSSNPGHGASLEWVRSAMAALGETSSVT